MSESPVAALVGMAYWDTLCDVAAVPVEGDSVVVRNLSWATGGMGRPAIALAQLFDTHLFTPVIGDHAGTLLRGELDSAGVVLHAGDAPHTPASTVLTGGVDRTCISGRPNRYGTANLNALNDADVRLVFGDGNNAEAYCELADRHPDALCSVDVGLKVRDSLAKAVWMADVVCGHAETLIELTRQDDVDDAAWTLLQGHPSLVVVTYGAAGATAWDDTHGRWHTPAPVVETKDATGSGDLFHAALVTLLADGVDAKGAIVTASEVGGAFAATWGNSTLLDGSVFAPVRRALSIKKSV